VHAWDVQQGKTYRITLTNMDDCANGGTDATIQVMVKNTNTGNVCVTATKTVDQTYVFDFTMPLSATQSACGTYPIDYCTSNCDPTTGIRARTEDGDDKQAHLRAATFGPGCSSPVEDTNCGPTCSPCTITCPAAKVLACGASTDTSNTGRAT